MRTRLARRGGGNGGDVEAILPGGFGRRMVLMEAMAVVTTIVPGIEVR
jgi:hypothetical protein